MKDAKTLFLQRFKLWDKTKVYAGLRGTRLSQAFEIPSLKLVKDNRDVVALFEYGYFEMVEKDGVPCIPDYDGDACLTSEAHRETMEAFGCTAPYNQPDVRQNES